MKSYSGTSKNSNKGWIVVLVVLIILSACYIVTNIPFEGEHDYAEHAGLLPVKDSEVLYYDPIESTVYIIFNEYTGYKGYGYMSPYYASNGLPYLYDPQTNQLVLNESK